MRSMIIGGLAVALSAACGEAETIVEPRSPAPSVPIESVHRDWTPANSEVEGLDVRAASTRRLSVPQLERSLDVIGGFPLGSVQLPDNLAFTLGQPDFQSVTEPSRDPSPLFMKFMVDLAAFVCGQILEADRARPEDDRVLSRFEDDEANLRALWLRFTGIAGDAATDDVQRLLDVQREATEASAGNVDAGRLAVCVAAATSPEFLLY